MNDERYGEKRREGITVGVICGEQGLYLSNVSPCSLKTVLQVAEYGTVPTSPFSVLPFVSYRVLQKKYCRELNICEQHAVGKDSAARGSRGLVHTHSRDMILCF